MSTQKTAVLALASLLGLAAVAATCAQERARAPWPSEVFNPKPRENAPGKFDYYTMVMSWSPTHCVSAEEGRDEQQCARQDGLRYGFVLHGLWPQYEKGYPEACPTGRKPFVPQPVISDMLDVMPSRGLVIHEYKVHGTCSGLDPEKYYKLSRSLFTRVRVPDRYRNPFETQFVAPRELIGEFMRANPWLRPEMIAVNCGGPGNRLRDIRICMNPDGAPRACGQNEDRRKLCRAEQMHVPPVRSTRRGSGSASSASGNDGADVPLQIQPQRDRGLPRPRVLGSP